MLDVLVNHFGLDKIRAKVTRPLAGLRVACYYGCLLDPSAGDRGVRQPGAPDLRWTTSWRPSGAEPVAWPFKTECCGASLSMTHSRRGEPLGPQAALDGAAGRGRVHGGRLSLVPGEPRSASGRRGQGPRRDPARRPVLYITQLLGLALGLSVKELGLEALTVSADAIAGRSPAAAAVAVAGGNAMMRTAGKLR